MLEYSWDSIFTINNVVNEPQKVSTRVKCQMGSQRMTLSSHFINNGLVERGGNSISSGFLEVISDIVYGKKCKT